MAPSRRPRHDPLRPAGTLPCRPWPSRGARNWEIACPSQIDPAVDRQRSQRLRGENAGLARRPGNDNLDVRSAARLSMAYPPVRSCGGAKYVRVIELGEPR
jgi:hypothetical protein